KRLLQIKIEQQKKNDEYIKRASAIYEQLKIDIQRDIEYFYKRYALNDKLVYMDVRKMLSKEEQHNWSMTLGEFRDKAKQGGYEQELNREYFRSRISRLQSLQTQLNLRIVELAVKEERNLKDHLIHAVKDT